MRATGDYRAHELTPLVDSKLGNKWADAVLACRTH